MSRFRFDSRIMNNEHMIWNRFITKHQTMQLFVVVVRFNRFVLQLMKFLPVVAMLVKLLNLKYTHNFSFVYS